MNMHDFVIIIFDIINFCVLIGLAAYFFAKKILPGVLQQIAEREFFLKNLIDQQKMLRKRTHDVVTTMDEQQRHAQELDHKMVLWQNAVEREQQKITVLLTTWSDQRRKRHKKQIDTFQEHTIIQNLIPEVVSSVRAELSDRYKHSQQAQVYIDRLMHAIK